MTLKTKFNFGDPAFIKHDETQTEYEVVGFIVRPGCLLIELSLLGDIIEMYDFQLTAERDEVKTLGLTQKEIDE